MLLDKLMGLSLTVGCGVYTGLLGASALAHVVMVAARWVGVARSVLSW